MPGSRAHRVEELGEVADLGFARGVLDDGRPAAGHGRHEQVLGRAHAREVEHHVCCPQTALGRDGVDVAVARG